MGKTPTPFYAIVYTSSTGEPFGTGPEYKSAKYLDMFADIVRQKRDPRNRQEWTKHKEREPQLPDPDRPVSRLPPYKQYMAEQEVKKKERARLEQIKKSGKEPKLEAPAKPPFDIDNDTLLAIIVGSSSVLVAWFAIKFLLWSCRPGDDSSSAPPKKTAISANGHATGTSTARP